MTQVRLAGSVTELKAAYRLLHDLYVEWGYQGPDPSGVRVLPQYLLPTTHTFVVVEDSGVTGTLTLIEPGALGLPLATDYGAEILSLPPECRPVEVSGFALRTGDARAKFALFRAAYAHSRFVLGATDLLITVATAHERFYERSLLFERVGPGRPCSQVRDTASVLLRLDLETVEERFSLRHSSGTIARHLAPREICALGGEEAPRARDARRRFAREVLAEAPVGAWAPRTGRILLEGPLEAEAALEGALR